MTALADGFENLLRATAWPMTVWQPYSPEHLALAAAGIAAAWFAARALACFTAGSRAGFTADSKAHFATASEARFATAPGARFATAPGARFVTGSGAYRAGNASRVIFVCGLILALMEVYKQGFLYYIENGGRFDWWYFPFQLCSVPMYLCLAFPFLGSGRAMRTTAVFLRDFGLLGGIMALAVPPGLMHPYWTMTLHGFFWHFILIFVGLYCSFCGLCDDTVRGFLRALPLFFACCLIATVINIAAGPASNADMFYISPYYPSTQPVFDMIAARLGILPEIALYLAATVCGGGLVHLLFGRRKNNP